MADRIAIFGGSFDPPHVGHLYIAEEVRSALGYERVLFVPSHLPPHKEPSLRIPLSERVELVRRAIEGNSAFVLEPFEVNRGGVSYTIDTVEYVLSTYKPSAPPALVVGDDLISGFRRWRDVDRLKKLVKVVVARRHDVSGEDIQAAIGDHLEIANALIAVSSSEIRTRIRNGQVYRYLVPERVYDYIRERGLYID